MNVIKLTEQQYHYLCNAQDVINEDVFISDISNKRNVNTATLTYNHGSHYNRGNKSSVDMLKTDRMDNGLGDNTYEVPLKGGFMSYNITDIRGSEIMHYFKHKKAKISINRQQYDIQMEDAEEKHFEDVFLAKVGSVVEYRTNQFKQQNKDVSFDKICIYPVPSSSNFNIEWTNKIIQHERTICGLPLMKLDTNLLQKNTISLERDDDFIQRNQSYYNSERFKMGGNGGTHEQAVQNAVNKLTKYENINNEIQHTNDIVEQLITQYYKINQLIKKGIPIEKHLLKLADLFSQYQVSVSKIQEASQWFDVISQQTHIQSMSKIARALKYTKGPSVEKRTGAIFDMLKENGLLNGVYRNNIHEVCRWEIIPFQIKYLGNDVRMALKNFFLPNKDEELVQQEVSKTHGGVVVVFDDNISGGSTLSDICMRLKKLGMEYIIPITFGKMRTSYSQGPNIQINKPIEDFNFD